MYAKALYVYSTVQGTIGSIIELPQRVMILKGPTLARPKRLCVLLYLTIIYRRTGHCQKVFTGYRRRYVWIRKLLFSCQKCYIIGQGMFECNSFRAELGA